MDTLRKLDLSITDYLRTQILPSGGYYINISTEALTSSDTLIWSAANKNWISCALSGISLNCPATVIPSGYSYIDYENGQVVYPIAQTSVAATYSYSVVKVVQGFPEDQFINDYVWPIVSVEYSQTPRKPYALGGGFFKRPVFYIDILANSSSERDDLEELICKNLKYELPLIDFSQGFRTLFTGDINPSFNYSTQFIRNLTIIDISPQVMHGSFLDMPRKRYHTSISLIVEYIE